MYLSPDAICSAYEGLVLLDDGHTGKRRREKTSALRYFFATAEINHNTAVGSDLSPSKTDNRTAFATAVGNVVRLDDTGAYTNDLRFDFKLSSSERAADYKTGNNFLTTRLNNGIRGGYPSRPSPLLTESAPLTPILHPNYATNIFSFGDWINYRGALAVWLSRNDDLAVSAPATPMDIASAIVIVLDSRYGSSVVRSLFPVADIESFLSSLSIALIDASAPDIISALDRLVNASSNSAPGTNTIVYGAPGTGKSFYLDSFQPCIRTVFYPDYLHSTFVGGYRPYVNAAGDITYRYIPGPFITAFISSIKSADEAPVYLIIEELNRANAAAVFGEVFQLLDRDVNGRSIYTITPDLILKEFLDVQLNGIADWQGELFIPSNLHLLASMNSADQGVEPLDAAFKRRWRYHFLPIDFSKIPAGDLRRDPIISHGGTDYSWVDFANALNSFLMSLGIDEDRFIGPFFMSESDLDDPNDRYAALGNKLLVYLWDDVVRHGLRHEVFSTSYHVFSQLIDDFLQKKWVFSDKFTASLTP